ncbi:MAG: glutamine--fructose-6-phosphate transaminase (isomerizing) [Oscillospiraceae bacterium]|jgi:glucosamine--fructose-6-phosphate aminotransferase (isomerizing)|nr:glutamine--fructose-6-phosphate transaminase (isomerizing) [Oscillospiraceae bacterium]
MCGIIGYAGEREAAPILLGGLRRLEYRGYDSAGLVVARDGKLCITKAAGYISNLSEAVHGGADLPGTVGLGHTRWATHGKPNETNAHPHISDGGKIAVVHNGTIENYTRLRDFLVSKGYEFFTQTDTEVAVNLIAYFYAESGDVLHAVASAARRMEGQYALGIICEDAPDTIIATKRDAPLFIAVGERENFIVSDVTAVLEHTRTIIRLRDYEIAVLTKDGVTLVTSELDEFTRETETVGWDVSSAEKGGFEHFMIKEITEQPDCVRAALSPRLRDGGIYLDGLGISDEYLRSVERIYITACGTASYVGLVAKYVVEKLARVPTEVVYASEFRYSDPIITDRTLVITLSQSGTTADTIAALREAKRRGAKVLSIVNVVGSVIAEESDWTLYTYAGPEICVASTKAYSTQLALSYVVALKLAQVRGTIEPERFSELLRVLATLPDAIAATLPLREQIQYLASRYASRDNMFFIGRNVDYALAVEGSHKLKEVSYIHSEAFAAGELKHGTIALIEDGTPVVTVAAYSPLLDKTLSNAAEVKSRGARVLAVTTESLREKVESNRDAVDDCIAIPDFEELFLPSLAIIPLQMFAYYCALERGTEIDKPRNLAKSVTVE